MNSKKRFFVFQIDPDVYTVDEYERNTFKITRRGPGEIGHVIYVPSSNSWHFDVDSAMTEEEKGHIADRMTEAIKGQELPG